jgi:hypothetical protein
MGGKGQQDNHSLSNDDDQKNDHMVIVFFLLDQIRMSIVQASLRRPCLAIEPMQVSECR